MLERANLTNARLHKFKRFNFADKVLASIFCFFIVVLFLKIRYPQYLVVDFFLFVTEASLVGGIADWFAVTALFKKPLGFPYHTAILPKNREKFTHSMVEMLDKEFLSLEHIQKIFTFFKRKEIFVDFLAKILEKEKLQTYFWDFFPKILANIDKNQLDVALGRDIKSALSKIPPAYFLNSLEKYLQSEQRLEIILAVLAENLQKEVESDNLKTKIITLLENLADNGKEDSNKLGGFLQGFLSLTNVLNYEEAASLFQEKIAFFLSELEKEGSEKQQLVLKECYLAFHDFKEKEENQKKLQEYYLRLLDCLPLEKALSPLLQKYIEDFSRLAKKEGDFFFVDDLKDIMQKLLQDVFKNEKLVAEFASIKTDLASSLAEEIKYVFILTCQDALQNFTDDELNSIIYEKTEPDLIWIRLNGSILGGILGAIIFCILELWK